MVDFIMWYECRLLPLRDWCFQKDGLDYFTVSGTGKELVVRRQLDFDQMRLDGRPFFLLNLTAMVIY